MTWLNLAPDLDHPERWQRKINPLRYYLSALGVGAGVGISWTILMFSAVAERYISHAAAAAVLYGFVVVVFALQIVFLLLENRRLKRDEAALQKCFEEIEEKIKSFSREQSKE